MSAASAFKIGIGLWEPRKFAILKAHPKVMRPPAAILSFKRAVDSEDWPSAGAGLSRLRQITLSTCRFRGSRCERAGVVDLRSSRIGRRIQSLQRYRFCRY